MRKLSAYEARVVVQGLNNALEFVPKEDFPTLLGFTVDEVEKVLDRLSPVDSTTSGRFGPSAQAQSSRTGPFTTGAGAGTSFGERLAATFERHGRLCVGIDPHPFLLDEWGLTDDAAGVREFGLRVVEAVAGRAGIVKPQVAFFERHGSAGYAALEDVLAAARAAELLVIADVKRGDIGSSVDAYAQAWLTPGSPLEADAITVNAYQGLGSLDAPIEAALENGKGLFVLAATSNPEAVDVQTAVIRSGPNSGMSVAAGIVAEVRTSTTHVRERSAEGVAPGSLASVGLVLGATVDLADYGITAESLASAPALPVLAPGFGHQGAALGDIDRLFGVAAPNVIASASRSVLSRWPSGLAAAVAEHVAELSV